MEIKNEEETELEYTIKEISEKLENYRNITEEIEEEIELLSLENSNENIELLEEVVEETLGIYGVNESIKDRKGGEVDTVYNVRNGIEYKNLQNKIDYEERGKYDKNLYHENSSEYKKIRKEYKKIQKNGNLKDGYSGKELDGKYDLDHVYSSNSIHEDKGRILAEIDGVSLANKSENLIPVNLNINRSKKEMDPIEYANKLNEIKRKNNQEKEKKLSKGSLTKKDEEKYENYNSANPDMIKRAAKKSEKAINKEINKKYYGGEKFRNDLMKATGKKAGNMAIKAAISEILLVGNKEFLVHIKSNIKKSSSIIDFLKELVKGLYSGLKKIVVNIKNIIVKVVKSFSNGILETLITTVINIFSTTAITIIKTIRQVIDLILNAKKSYENITSNDLRARKKEILSLILKGILVLPIFNGVGITDKIEEVMRLIGIPDIISDMLALGLTTMLGSGLVFIGARVFEKIKDMVKEKERKKLNIMNENLKMQVVAGEAFITQKEIQEFSEFTRNYIVKMNMRWDSEILKNKNLLSDYNKVINEFTDIEIFIEENKIDRKYRVNEEKILDLKKEVRNKINKIKSNI